MEGRYNNHSSPFEVYIVNKKKHEQGENVGAWLNLPTTPANLRDLLQIIGGDRDGWLVADVEPHVYGMSVPLLECKDINELNYLAAKIEDLDEDELGTFQAVIEIDEHCDTTEELINLTGNLDCYEVQPEISD